MTLTPEQRATVIGWLDLDAAGQHFPGDKREAILALLTAHDALAARVRELDVLNRGLIERLAECRAESGLFRVEKERDALAAENRQLADALEALLTVQNDAPLEKYRKEWEVACEQGWRLVRTATRPPEAPACEHFERLADIRGGPEVCCACGKTVGHYVPEGEAPKGGPRHPCACRSYNHPEPGQSQPEVVLPIPMWAQGDGDKVSVCVDACIAPVVLALWEARIWTVGSCCGHGTGQRSVIISSHVDREKARRVVESIGDSATILAWELI